MNIQFGADGISTWCECGFVTYNQAEVSVKCEACDVRSKMLNFRKVDCAHPDHNHPDGCGNPKCWKSNSNGDKR